MYTWYHMQNMYYNYSNRLIRPLLRLFYSFSIPPFPPVHFAVSFNGDISSWDTRSVTNMARMLLGASGFLGDISSWNVERCTDFTHMFAGARFVNENYCTWGSLLNGRSDVGAIETRGMFLATACPITDDPNRANFAMGPFCHLCTTISESPNLPSTYDPPDSTVPIHNTAELHDAVSSYLQSSRSWVSAAATTYGWPIGTWDVSAVTDFSHTFDVHREPLVAFFDEDLEGWDTSRARSMAFMFRGTSQSAS